MDYKFKKKKNERLWNGSRDQNQNIQFQKTL